MIAQANSEKLAYCIYCDDRNFGPIADHCYANQCCAIFKVPPTLEFFGEFHGPWEDDFILHVQNAKWALYERFKVHPDDGALIARHGCVVCPTSIMDVTLVPLPHMPPEYIPGLNVIELEQWPRGTCRRRATSRPAVERFVSAIQNEMQKCLERPYLSASHLAAHFGVDIRGVQAVINTGQIEAVMVGDGRRRKRQFLVSILALRKFLANPESSALLKKRTGSLVAKPQSNVTRNRRKGAQRMRSFLALQLALKEVSNESCDH